MSKIYRQDFRPLPLPHPLALRSPNPVLQKHAARSIFGRFNTFWRHYHLFPGIIQVQGLLITHEHLVVLGDLTLLPQRSLRPNLIPSILPLLPDTSPFHGSVPARARDLDG